MKHNQRRDRSVNQTPVNGPSSPSALNLASWNRFPNRQKGIEEVKDAINYLFSKHPQCLARRVAIICPPPPPNLLLKNTAKMGLFLSLFFSQCTTEFTMWAGKESWKIPFSPWKLGVIPWLLSGGSGCVLPG